MTRPGIFTISIDVELAWGTCDKPLDADTRRGLDAERGIVRGVLDLFRRYNIQASWAIVAHLLATDCPWHNGTVHPEIPRPVNPHHARDWFFHHPDQGSDDPHWFGSDLVDAIRSASPPQEVGSHSFCHMLYGEAGTNPAAVEADLTAARRLHDRHGLDFRIFVFPRNAIGFKTLLRAHGIEAYRGLTARWYHRVPFWLLTRLFHLSSFVLGMTPPTVVPSIDEADLVNVPDSMLLCGRNGLRRFVSSRSLIAMARRGLNRAAERGELFHLWFHPSNFYTKTAEQFRVLESILVHADSLRRRDRLEVLTMGQVADRVRKQSRTAGGEGQEMGEAEG